MLAGSLILVLGLLSATKIDARPSHSTPGRDAGLKRSGGAVQAGRVDTRDRQSGSWSYLGCIDRTVSHMSEGYAYHNDHGTTAEICQDTCERLGFDYAGLDDSHTCHCDSSIDNSALKALRDAGRSCSDSDRYQVYQLSSPSSTASPKSTRHTRIVERATVPFSSLGCWQDAAQRTLSGPNTYLASMTQGSCASYCSDQGYKYAGAEATNQCYCGNTYDTTRAISAGNCTYACAGDSTSFCGGNWAMNLLAVNGAPTLAPTLSSTIAMTTSTTTKAATSSAASASSITRSTVTSLSMSTTTIIPAAITTTTSKAVSASSSSKPVVLSSATPSSSATVSKSSSLSLQVSSQPIAVSSSTTSKFATVVAAVSSSKPLNASSSISTSKSTVLAASISISTAASSPSFSAITVSKVSSVLSVASSKPIASSSSAAIPISSSSSIIKSSVSSAAASSIKPSSVSSLVTSIKPVNSSSGGLSTTSKPASSSSAAVVTKPLNTTSTPLPTTAPSSSATHANLTSSVTLRSSTSLSKNATFTVSLNSTMPSSTSVTLSKNSTALPTGASSTFSRNSTALPTGNATSTILPAVTATQGCNAACTSVVGAAAPPKAANTKSLFAHHMVGNTYSYTPSVWADDIALAKSAGIDGFALNYGRDVWQPARVDDAYSTANAMGFKLFLSLDVTSLSCSSSDDAITHAASIVRHANSSAQYIYQNRTLVSTFGGEYCNFGQSSNLAGWTYLRQLVLAQGYAIYLIPAVFADTSSFNTPSMAWMDGEFNWNSGWPMGSTDLDTSSDATYQNALAGKTYLPAISPAFFTYYGPNTYNKDWIYRSDDWLLATRLEQIVQMRNQVDFAEIISWNDYGESHYIGPIRVDQPNSQGWTNGMPHTAWLSLISYYAPAFKYGSYPSVSDNLWLWSRPHPRAAVPSAPTAPQPTGWSYTDDNLYAMVTLSAPANLTISSGVNNGTWYLSAGVNKVSLASAPGAIGGTISRGSKVVKTFDSTGIFTYTTTPVDYNFNYYVAQA